MATKFYYGKKGETLAEDENGNVSEIFTMGNYCDTPEERAEQKRRIEEKKKKRKKAMNNAIKIT